ncbi:MAG: cyclic nucleotide-binding/CBS domain-containing protein [Acidobacteria bacterium]|nr:MAG: cyclic nucleotide-binding/CBS domain-containing protein [Acidobacteriota bacterium]MCE7956649.1 cyclic nucleotide-binding/CBS domain-containing protein [Acidobacteria bacterium ACB2]
MASSSVAPPPPPPLDPRSFLRQTPPFDQLPPDAFEEAAAALEIAYHPAGTTVLTADGLPSEALHLVRKGIVRLEREGETALVLEEGDFFGFSVLTGRVVFDVVVEEDLLAYRIPEKVFRGLLQHAPFARFFTQGLTERLRSAPAGPADTALGGDVLSPVSGLLERAAVTLRCDATVGEAARMMREERVSSVILRCTPPAIVTDRDLRNRVLAEGAGPQTPVLSVATRPLRTIPHTTPVYGALQAMLQHGIHHLPVERDGEIVGVVTSTDLLRLQSHGPLLAFKKVEKMRGRDSLASYGRDLSRMVATLSRSGLPATQVARLVSHLNDALARRLLAWAERDLGAPPCPYAFLVFGSEGRFEQTLLTDQDNALVHADDGPEAARYFSALAEKVVADLVAAGFPPCPGGYMATKWNGPLSAWTERFAGWIETPQAEAVLAAAIFFDFRSVGGTLDLTPLHDLLASAHDRAPFLSHMARAAVGFRPPLGAFRRLEVEDGGVDLKKGGIAPVQGLARVWGLDAGLTTTETVGRLHGAAAAGILDRTTAEGLAEAYQFLLGLRLREQLRALSEDRLPGNRVPIEALGQTERRHLKEAFLAVRDAQKWAIERYRVVLA